MRRILAISAALVLAVTSLAIVPFAPHAAALSIQNRTLISASPSGQPGNDHSFNGLYMTPNARYVVYQSYARNLTDDVLPYPSSEHLQQTFVYDRQQHTTELVSRTTAGDIGNQISYPAGVSDDGRFVLFFSRATNFPGYFQNNVLGATSFLYVRDRQNGTTVRIGDPTYPNFYAAFMSGDGSTIVYQAMTFYNSPFDQGNASFIYDRTTDSTTQFPTSYYPSTITDNGRYISYSYYDGQITKGYRYDRTDGSSVEIGPNTSYLQLTPDGSHASYGIIGPGASSISQIYYRDIATGQQQLVFDSAAVSGDPNGMVWMTPSVSANGQVVAAHIRSVENNRTVKRLWVTNVATGETAVVVNDNFGYNTIQSLTPDGSELAFNDYNTYGDNFSNIFEAHIDTSVADAIPPVVGLPVWSANPKATTQTSMLTVPASDNVGVVGGEYFVGDTDPGKGNGTAMSWDGTNLSTTFDTNLTPGIYTVSVRARDAAGNWTDPAASDYLVVFDPTGPTDFAASKQVVPSIAGGDILPGLLSDNQKDKVRLGFDVLYTPTGTVDPASGLSLDYATGKCNSPHSDNCHATNFTVTSQAPNVINWLTISGTGSSVGTFQGKGTLIIDGVATVNPFKVQGTDGGRTTPTQNDDATLYIYPVGANPSTDLALYKLHINIAGNWLKIN